MSDRRQFVVERGGERVPDLVCVEEPLEIRVEEEVLAVTMRTPGHDRELAAGFLYTQGIVERRDDLTALEPLPGGEDRNTIVARVAGGVERHADAIRRAARTFFASSACGVCGAAALPRIEELAPPFDPWSPDDALLRRLTGLLATDLFTATHGAHAAVLVSRDGTPEVCREDVGRHNAVDKVLGWRFLQGRTPVDGLLLVSGRAGFEIVHKARMAGVPALVSVGAASSLAIELAHQGGLSLVGFLRPGSWTRY